MLACMNSWMCVLVTYQNMCITLKIQLLHLKSDFITFKFIEGLVALCARYSVCHILNYACRTGSFAMYMLIKAVVFAL